MINYLKPKWNAPSRVHALTTLRTGGFSTGAYASFNLGDHVGDDAAAVTKNRQKLCQVLALQREPLWLKQVHGTQVINWTNELETSVAYEADACFTRLEDHPCVVLTADCLPVVICDRAGTVVAAVHAGWKGLLSGVIEATVRAMNVPGETLLAWMGPAIGPLAFEVDDAVRNQFIAVDPQAKRAFKPGKAGKWLADIFLLGKQRLNNVGVTAVFGGYACTYTKADQFFSFRRDKDTGRLATLIWLGSDNSLGT
jgi:YfiH family protein